MANESQTLIDKKTQDLYKQSAIQSGASAFSTLMGGYINYATLNTDAYASEVEANQVELNAKEKANALRERYLSSAGNMLFASTMRGGRSSSGSIQKNLEMSAKALNEDTANVERTGQAKAKAMRIKASLEKTRAKSELVSSTLSAIGSGINAYNAGKIGFKGDK